MSIGGSNRDRGRKTLRLVRPTVDPSLRWTKTDPSAYNADGTPTKALLEEKARKGLVWSDKAMKFVFGKGNLIGKGWSATHRRNRAFQRAAHEAVTEKDIRDVMQALVREAKRGNVAAAREVLDRTCGKVDESVVVKRLEELEELWEKQDKEAA